MQIERLPARLYYGHRAPGQVVLVNGHVEFHGRGRDARAFEARLAIARGYGWVEVDPALSRPGKKKGRRV